MAVLYIVRCTKTYDRDANGPPFTVCGSVVSCVCVCCLVRVNYYEIREGAHGKTAGAGVESGQEVRNMVVYDYEPVDKERDQFACYIECCFKININYCRKRPVKAGREGLKWYDRLASGRSFDSI